MRTLFAAVALAAILLASATAAAPAPPTQYVRKTSGPILALAADGDRAAFIVEGRVKECMSVMVWDPGHRRIARLQSGAAKCESSDRLNRRGAPAVAIAGARTAWLQLTGGNNLETILFTATLARPKPVWLGYGAAADGIAGSFVRQPVGDGSLLAFTTETRCHPDYGAGCPPGRQTGDIIESTVWRVGGTGRCPSGPVASPVRCSVVAKADSELSVLAVDAGRIAARTEDGIRLLTLGGRVLQDLPVRASAAALSGNRLAVRTSGAVEVYNTGSAKLTDRFVAANGVGLQDLERDILITASRSTFTLRRLDNGRTTTIRVNRTTLARLEQTGLFFTAGARRVVFMPMREVRRRSAAKRPRRAIHELPLVALGAVDGDAFASIVLGR
jgi:hypothetical protein